MEATQRQGKTRCRALADGDLQVVDGDAACLAGKLLERHGIAKDEARKQINAFDTEKPEN